ncbi:KH domain-containing protein At4g18375-like isoform X2 [Diospyros lotus]|uniref:KH domain-containing protein At4g18375-like isoform X2 n=1 Tax=Diospyros lotus TaxID=55363 RepID=UPI00224F0F1E|nr:KH domain-containing protein At4g18375-like isoform X2 [Diospyros lotus]
MPPVLSIPLLSYEERTENGNGLHMLYSSSLDSYGSLSMGDTDYGSLSSYSSKLLPPPSTLEMIVPAHAVGKVMGKGGANIDNICKISGVVLEISDSNCSWGDRVALISGTSEQKHTGGLAAEASAVR